MPHRSSKYVAKTTILVVFLLCVQSVWSAVEGGVGTLESMNHNNSHHSVVVDIESLSTALSADSIEDAVDANSDCDNCCHCLCAHVTMVSHVFKLHNSPHSLPPLAYLSRGTGRHPSVIDRPPIA